MFEAINIAQMIVMTRARNQYSHNTEIFKNNSIPILEVLKFTTSNFESFMYNLKSAVSRVHGIYRAFIGCLFREVGGNCNDNWMNRREKLNNFLSLASNQCKHESALF